MPRRSKIIQSLATSSGGSGLASGLMQGIFSSMGDRGSNRENMLFKLAQEKEKMLSEQQKQLTREAGDFIQNYVFVRPVSEEEADPLLKDVLQGNYKQLNAGEIFNYVVNRNFPEDVKAISKYALMSKIQQERVLTGAESASSSDLLRRLGLKLNAIKTKLGSATTLSQVQGALKELDDVSKILGIEGKQEKKGSTEVIIENRK